MDDKFWAEFEKALGTGDASLPPPGKGWFSLSEYSKQYKVSSEIARLRLRRMVANGKLERERAKGTNPNRLSYYRLVTIG